MGGRGAGLNSGGSGQSVNIAQSVDVWSYRHRADNEPFVDAINSSARDMEDDFPGLMNSTVTQVNAATLRGADVTQTLGFYTPADKSVSLNTNYTDVDKMNRVYDRSVASGYHPSRGNKNGTEAVAYHELGHALTDHVGQKMGAADIDDAAKTIVNRAYRASGNKGGKSWAAGISGYAAENYAECVAEAVCDWYCNGRNSAAQSQAIMAEMFKYK